MLNLYYANDSTAIKQEPLTLPITLADASQEEAAQHVSVSNEAPKEVKEEEEDEDFCDRSFETIDFMPDFPTQEELQELLNENVPKEEEAENEPVIT